MLSVVSTSAVILHVCIHFFMVAQGSEVSIIKLKAEVRVHLFGLFSQRFLSLRFVRQTSHITVSWQDLGIKGRSSVGKLSSRHLQHLTF